MNSAAISPEDYITFQKFLEKSSGILLGDNKEYLVSSRLSRLMRDFNVTSFNELIKIIQSDSRLRQNILDAMTTNETSWFRDSYPYEILKEKLLPEYAQNKAQQVKIWSAACSSGQEPYSISMIASEYTSSRPGAIPMNGIQVSATDLSSTIVQQAKQGRYEGVSVNRGLSEERKKRFFKPIGDHWEIVDDVKRRISFREMNLMQSYAGLGKFDIIYCRNVLIYFSQDLKKDIISRMAQSLKPKGYLILGGSESISGYSDAFDLVRWKSGVIYQLK